MNRFPILLVILACFCAGCLQHTDRAEFEFQTMGTVARCDLELPAGLSPPATQALVAAVYDSVIAVFSTWQTDSELSRINRAPADSALTVSPWLTECLTATRRLNRLSGGAFDPTAGSLMRLWGFYSRQGRLPGRADLDSTRTLLGRWALSADGELTKSKAGTAFDLGGIAKGLAVDLVAQRLRRAGVTNGLIDLGGNLFCLGGAPDRSDWRVGVRDPLNRAQYFAAVTVTGLGVATSGSYERFVTIEGRRYGHIMNPATGRPAEGLLSVTVFAPTALLADGLSTTLFVLGPDKGRDLLANLPETVEALLVVPGDDGGRAQVLITPGLAGRISLLPDYEGQYELTPWF